MMNLLVNTLGGWMAKYVSFGSEVAPIKTFFQNCSRLKQSVADNGQQSMNGD